MDSDMPVEYVLVNQHDQDTNFDGNRSSGLEDHEDSQDHVRHIHMGQSPQHNCLPLTEEDKKYYDCNGHMLDRTFKLNVAQMTIMWSMVAFSTYLLHF